MGDSKSVHGKLMEDAYKLWETDKKLLYEDFLNEVKEKLGPLHFNAVITGNLNYQVENGGFLQWIENEYHVTISEIIDFLSDLENNETIRSLIMILEQIDDVLQFTDEGKKICRNISYEYKDFFITCLDENIAKEIDSMNVDERYYSIKDEFINMLETYFKTEFEKNGKNGESN